MTLRLALVTLVTSVLLAACGEKGGAKPEPAASAAPAAATSAKPAANAAATATASAKKDDSGW